MKAGAASPAPGDDRLPASGVAGGFPALGGLAFVCNRRNLNSIAVLTGALEIDRRTARWPLHFLWQDEHLTPRLRELGREAGALAVALSLTTAGMAEAGRLLAHLRALRPRPVILAGGAHPSARPAETLNLGVDVVVTGEGEAVLPSLLDRLAHGESLAGLAGISFRDKKGRVVRGRRPRPVDLDAYPPLSVTHKRFGPIEITRGCPRACSFCQTSFLFGGRLRHRSVKRVVDWVERAMARGYDYVRFVTPNALTYQSPDNGLTVNLDAIERLLRKMAGLVGRERVYFGTFPSEFGPELVTPEAATLVRRYCGNRDIIIGAQSGSDRVLEAMGRSHSVADVYRAAEVLVAGGLRPIVDLIFGLPGERPADVKATISLAEDLVEKGAVIHSHTFMPLPGTPLEDAAPGRVDPALHAFLDRLASKGQQVGQWRKQEEIARRRARVSGWASKPAPTGQA